MDRNENATIGASHGSKWNYRDVFSSTKLILQDPVTIHRLLIIMMLCG